MSLYGRRAGGAVTRAPGDSQVNALIPPRGGAGNRGTAQYVNNDTAMRHSAVWACLRLRANLISTFPRDVYRKVGDDQIEVPKGPLVLAPGGPSQLGAWHYWMYASQVDLDRSGNTIGLITETDAVGRPTRIELQAISACSVVQQAGKSELLYRINGKLFPESKVWHERQYVVAGLPVGLSPVAYAAATIGEYLSIQDFALDWFGSGGVPKARLKNSAKTLDQKETAIIKDRWNATMSNGDLFVHGNDWEYDFMQAEAMGSEWIDAKKYSVTDISRFFDAPADLIEAAVAGSSVTYASITQRNLQLLVMSLNPAVVRRELNISAALPQPRYLKLNTDALLRMDPETRAKVLGMRLTTRQITPTEARRYENLSPFTAEDLAEIEAVYGPPKAPPTPASKP